MQDNKDRLQAHLYLASRLRSAIVSGDPNLAQLPMNRTKRGVYGGVVLSILLLAGFALFGVIRPGGRSDWAEEGAIVVEKESGARFLYTDGALHPVLNFSSALLAGGDGSRMPRVSRASLAEARRGPTIGIPGAPDALPETTELDDAEWAICAVDGADAGSAAISVVLGAGIAGDGIEDGEAVLVRPADDGAVHLVTARGSHAITDKLTLAALGLDGAAPVTVDPAWLNALPASSPIVVPSLGPPGAPVTLANGVTADPGDLIGVGMLDGSTNHYVVVADGLAPVSEMVAALLLAGGANSGSVEIEAAAAADVAAAPASTQRIGDDQWPSTVPTLRQPGPDAVPCVVFELRIDDSAVTRVSMMSMPEGALVTEVADDAVTDRTADRIVSSGNVGAILHGETSGEGTDVWFLITETGVKHPIGSAADLDALGFLDTELPTAPNSLVDFLPTGPGLNSDDARLEARADSRP